MDSALPPRPDMHRPVIRHRQQLLLDGPVLPIDEAGCGRLRELLYDHGGLSARAPGRLTDDGEIKLVVDGGYEIVLSRGALAVAIDWRYESGAASAAILHACLRALAAISPNCMTPRQGVRMLYAFAVPPADVARLFRPEVSLWSTSSILGDDATSDWKVMVRFAGPAQSLINEIVIRSEYHPAGLHPEIARPHEAGAPTFLLDIDVDSVHDRRCEPDALAQLMRMLGQRVQSLFVASQLDGTSSNPRVREVTSTAPVRVPARDDDGTD